MLKEFFDWLLGRNRPVATLNNPYTEVRNVINTGDGLFCKTLIPVRWLDAKGKECIGPAYTGWHWKRLTDKSVVGYHIDPAVLEQAAKMMPVKAPPDLNTKTCGAGWINNPTAYEQGDYALQYINCTKWGKE